MSTTATTVGAWTGEGFAHEGFVYDSEAEVRARVVPFVAEGIQRGEATIVVASETVREVLGEALGADREALAVFADSAGFWQGDGHQTLVAYLESMGPLLEAGRPWRLVGEPTWLALPAGGAWSRFEAVANDAFADYPYYSLCLHDRRRLSPALVDNARRTHPLVWDGGEVVPSPHYEPTEDFLRSVEPPWTPAPEHRESVAVVTCGPARRYVRSHVVAALAERTEDIALAVHEIVANALDAAGTAELSHWQVGSTQVWEVRDDGPGLHGAASGYSPPALDLADGRGLWLARSLADEMVVRPHGPGTAVRLLFSVS
jgi:anti-sigma regulatory factor (Ser/Thr protein kinase)